jgi:hypothetical protein
MSNNTGGPAFPCTGRENTIGRLVHPDQQGMSLRDYIAAKVVANLAAMDSRREFGIESDAYLAYRVADAMLEARKE